MAAVLKAECCEIIKEVDGVCSADPRIVANSKPLRQLDFASGEVDAQGFARSDQVWVNLSRILQMMLIDAQDGYPRPNCDGQRCRDLRLRNTGRYRGTDQKPLTHPQQQRTSSRRASGLGDYQGRRSCPFVQ